MGELNKQLEAVESGIKNTVPIKAYEILQQSVKQLQRNGIAKGLSANEQAPDFTLRDSIGKEINLFEELESGPVILVFYRGSWCPFCNIQLRAYQKILPQVQELGATLIAVSPQSPDDTLNQQEKENLTFIVASDTDGRVAKSYHVLYEVSDSLRSVLENFGGSLLDYDATNEWILPVPATFVIDSKGTIQFAHVDPNFMRRLEPEQLLQVLKNVKGRK